MGKKAYVVSSEPVIFARKNGNGPWLIDPNCKAVESHNTFSAARGDMRRTGGMKVHCTCPRALFLLEQSNAARKRQRAAAAGFAPTASLSERQLSARRRKWPLIDVGYGPWMVLEHCPATTKHNTLAAARGHGGSSKRCICPHATAIHGEYLARQNLRNRALRRGDALPDGRKEGGARAVNAHLGAVRAASFAVVLAGMPDLSDGRCTRLPGAREIFDAAHSSTDDDGSKIERAKQVCSSCPLATREACADWALKGERTPGDWGGVYGGLSTLDRIRIRYGTRAVAA